jgi:uncharacterized protein involved in exopolysaccharide biosynthesis
MSTKVQENLPPTGDISLYGLFSLFIRNWLILVVSGLSFAIIALIWVINTPNIYEAETLLMPAGNEKGGLSGLAGNLGGLASLAGMSLGEGGNDNSKLALELMESRYFIKKFIKKYELTAPVMAAKSWDVLTNKLIYNEKIYDVNNKKWVRDVVAPKQKKPSPQETYEEFIKLISIEQDPKTKFVKFSIEFVSPHMAAKWTRDFVRMLNDDIREKDNAEADENISYLKNLIVSSNLSELKRIFSGLMEEQIKSKMLSEVRKDYVFKVVDPAIAPENKSKPKRALIVIAAGFLGGIIGLVIVLYRSGRKAVMIN